MASRNGPEPTQTPGIVQNLFILFIYFIYLFSLFIYLLKNK